MSKLGHSFLRESAKYLGEVYLPRIERALAILPEKDLWRRPHRDVISVGMILQHLDGNVRQWILSGLGGESDARARATEFEKHERATAAELLANLRSTVEQSAALIAGLSKHELKRSHRIQDFEVTGLDAIYHVVEHFSWHTGQLVWLAKACAGRDHGLSFYDTAAINAAHNAPDTPDDSASKS
ncbi:MAG: hypothetical protein DHS20C15_33230 [Planctomycetota bacterium]|nr:MAG: hypothetical protein DHS20C15_33230 [Planctomycetota bacterium]